MSDGPAAAAAPALELFCPGCGYHASGSGLPPLRCPRAARSDDLDHVFIRFLEPAALGGLEPLRAAFLDPEPHPFLRYRALLISHQAALAGGLGEDDWERLVRALDRAVAEVDGAGLLATPFARQPRLAAELGLDGELWVKDETGNVTGSHKSRHLFGVLLALEVQRRVAGKEGDDRRPLAIASCGNAALAAAVMARAAGRALEVYIPVDADPTVVRRLESLGAATTVCRREQGSHGDPTVRRFREAIADGRAVPVSCQGQENSLILEGGMTLGWEMVSEMLRQGAELDRVFVQVGGGALARAIFGAFKEARQIGLIARLPRFFAVQTEGAYPLLRAYDRVAARILHRRESPPAGRSRAERAARILDEVPAAEVDAALEYAGRHRATFMWPWEETPRSIATGILDDETYDWLAIVRGLLESGGYPVVVGESRLCEANGFGADHTGIAVDPTGSAGLAGCLELLRRGELDPAGTTAVLFTGVRRRPLE